MAAQRRIQKPYGNSGLSARLPFPSGVDGATLQDHPEGLPKLPARSVLRNARGRRAAAPSDMATPQPRCSDLPGVAYRIVEGEPEHPKRTLTIDSCIGAAADYKCTGVRDGPRVQIGHCAAWQTSPSLVTFTWSTSPKSTHLIPICRPRRPRSKHS